jgi:hypothetical protein
MQSRFSFNLIFPINMKACKQCREAKRRCVRSKANLVALCNRCQCRHLPCSNSYSQRTGRRTLVARSASPLQLPTQLSSRVLAPPDPVSEFLADEKAVAELVHLYLTKIHDRPHSIFHAQTLWSDINQRRTPKALLLAICAMGAHLSTRERARSLEPLLTTEAKQLLQADSENVCIENIQTCILVGNLCAAHANPSSELLFFRKSSPVT